MENYITSVSLSSGNEELKKYEELEFHAKTLSEAIEPTFKKNLETLLYAVDNGLAEPIEIFKIFKGMEAILKRKKAQLEPTVVEYLNRHGKIVNSDAEYSLREGYDTLDYEKDDVYTDLKAKLEQRKSLIDNVTKKKTIVYDESGVLVERVPVKTSTKSSVVIKLKNK